MESKNVKLTIERKGVIGFKWSPLDTFIITCEKYTKGQKNLLLWDVSTGE
jgi:Tol biopolymer transport system component